MGAGGGAFPAGGSWSNSMRIRYGIHPVDGVWVREGGDKVRRRCGEVQIWAVCIGGWHGRGACLHFGKQHLGRKHNCLIFNEAEHRMLGLRGRQ